MDILNKINKYLNEGTWAYPDSMRKVKEFKKIIKSPITPAEAKRKLYNIIGSDDFYDSMDDVFRKEDQDKDVRWFVADWIKENWLTSDAQKTFIKKWDENVYKEVERIVNKKYK